MSPRREHASIATSWNAAMPGVLGQDTQMPAMLPGRRRSSVLLGEKLEGGGPLRLAPEEEDTWASVPRAYSPLTRVAVERSLRLTSLVSPLVAPSGRSRA